MILDLMRYVSKYHIYNTKFIWNGKQTSSDLYSDSQAMFDTLRHQFKHEPSITFCGAYVLASDPLVTDKERVQMMAGEVWKVIGYRFTYVLAIIELPQLMSCFGKCAGQSSAAVWP
jgi:hypothetical protein